MSGLQNKLGKALLSWVHSSMPRRHSYAKLSLISPRSVLAIAGGGKVDQNRSFASQHETAPSSSVVENDCVSILKLLATRVNESKSLAKPHTQFHTRLNDVALSFASIYSSSPPIQLDKPLSERVSAIRFIGENCIPTDHDISNAIAHYTAVRDSADPDLKQGQAYTHLKHACTPLYEDVFRCLLKASARSGMSFVVSFRRDLLQYLAYLKAHHHSKEVDLMAKLKAMDEFLQQMLSIWFSPEMLELRRITYEGTSASIIETIAKQEAVHPVRNLDDLRNRLSQERRVFALFHPLLPDQPLVVLYVSLQPVIPESMSQVYEQAAASKDARVACFYSISNMQSGLAGVGLGELLIKEAVRSIQEELPLVDTFTTLSPIPSFRKWIQERVVHASGKFAATDLITNQDAASLSKCFGCPPSESLSHLLKTLDEMGADNFVDSPHRQLFERVLSRLVARYLVLEKHRRKPLDSVARFHLGNGAELFRINRAANMSRTGWQSSFGFMVNYLYKLSHVGENQAFFENDFQFPVHDQVKELLQ